MHTYAVLCVFTMRSWLWRGIVFNRGALCQFVEYAARNPAKIFVPAMFHVLLTMLPTERGLGLRLKHGQCIDESEVEADIAKRHLEHVTRLSEVREQGV